MNKKYIITIYKALHGNYKNIIWDSRKSYKTYAENKEKAINESIMHLRIKLNVNHFYLFAHPVFKKDNEERQEKFRALPLITNYNK